MMDDATLALSARVDSGQEAAGHAGRLREIVDGNFELVWRLLRGMGVPEVEADDAAQNCFVVVAQRLERIEHGAERAFLVQTAIRVALAERRARQRRREAPEAALAALLDPSPGADDRLERARQRALLDHVLDTMPDELRTVFVLYELESMNTAEVAALQGIPRGTVASRLKRAREHFDAQVVRLRARLRRGEAP